MAGRVWPVAVAGTWRGSRITLRPLRVRADRREFSELRAANAAWTGPWDSTSPHPRGTLTFAQLVRQQDREAREGRSLPWVIDVDGRIAGQMHLFSIVEGALLSGAAGYWIGREFAGRGITPYALALLIDYSFEQIGLHRVEVNIRPTNANSLRVAAKLGLREEGMRLAYLHINGAWHDHRSFALTVEELGGERMVDRLNRLASQQD